MLVVEVLSDVPVGAIAVKSNGDGGYTVYEDGDVAPEEELFGSPETSISLTPRQFRQALNAFGLRAMTESAVAQANQDTKDWYEFSTSFESTHPVVLQMAAAMGKTAADVNALFSFGTGL